MAVTAAATYGNDPENSELDQVRLLIGDTTCADALLLDSEINYFLATTATACYAAAEAARAIAAKFARKVTIGTGGVSKSLSDLMQHFLDLSKNLRTKADELGGAPVFTALRRNDKIEDREDEDLVQPTFFRGRDDNPRKSQTPDQGRADPLP